MPTYEYHCRDCDEVFERVEPMTEHEKTRPACPECGGQQVEQVFSTFFAKTARKS